MGNTKPAFRCSTCMPRNILTNYLKLTTVFYKIIVSKVASTRESRAEISSLNIHQDVDTTLRKPGSGLHQGVKVILLDYIDNNGEV